MCFLRDRLRLIPYVTLHACKRHMLRNDVRKCPYKNTYIISFYTFRVFFFDMICFRQNRFSELNQFYQI